MTRHGLITSAQLRPLDSDHFDRLVAPYTLESYSVSDQRWKAIVSAQHKYVNSKLLQRKLLSRFGLTKSAASFRSPEYVKETYDRIWLDHNIPPKAKPGSSQKITYLTWRDRGLALVKGSMARSHLDRLIHLIGLLKPRRVLEVGCGSGLNLFPISMVYPEISFSGLELSKSGVDTAKKLVQMNALPEELIDFCPCPVTDRSAFRRVSFVQGTAASLPFEPESFDLVFSRLAIEQMDHIKDQVFREIARVSARNAAFIEPFSDFCQSELQRLSTIKKNHFGSPVSSLAAYRLQVDAVFDDWPQKIDQGSGLVVASKAGLR
jgi:ubiquinone/menaquinone biosynthesis C-methylase UbiE